MSQNNSSGSEAKRIESQRKIDFVLKPRFTNNVPDVPFDAKFMPCPFVPLSRFVEYNQSTLEKEHKHPVICDDDMGLSVDLIDLHKYDEDSQETELNIKDQYLLDDETASKMNQKRSQQHSKLVPWMRKTEYISTEFNRFGVTADRQETKLGYNLKKNQLVEDMYRDKQSQIDAINKTFEDVRKQPTEHYSKKGVKPVEECYIFPDFNHWKYPFTYVQFDGDTITSELEETTKKQAQENSIIKGMERGDDKTAALFVPNIECLTNMMEDMEMDRPFQPDVKYEFLLSREYTWKSEKVPPRDRDVFAMYYRDGKFEYNEIDCNMKMARKRNMILSRKSRIMVMYRPFDAEEQQAMNQRNAELFEQPKSRKQELAEIKEAAESDESSDSDVKPSKPAADSSSEESSGDEAPKKRSDPTSSEDDDSD